MREMVKYRSIRKFDNVHYMSRCIDGNCIEKYRQTALEVIPSSLQGQERKIPFDGKLTKHYSGGMMPMSIVKSPTQDPYCVQKLRE